MERGRARIFRSRRANTGWFSLTPCFSWVRRWHRRQNRFNGLQQSVETVETVPASFDAVFTQLKQGVNERTSKSRSMGHEICAPGSEAVLAPLTPDSCLRSIFNLQFAEPRVSTLNTGCSTLSIIPSIQKPINPLFQFTRKGCCFASSTPNHSTQRYHRQTVISGQTKTQYWNRRSG